MGEFHKIIFKDNGIGIDSAYAANIFKMFKRLHEIDPCLAKSTALVFSILEAAYSLGRFFAIWKYGGCKEIVLSAATKP